MQHLVTGWPRPETRAAAGLGKHAITEAWIEKHADVVQRVLAHHADAIRLALDIVGTQLNASGMTLEHAVNRPSLEEVCEAFHCFLANIQVWGSRSECRDMPMSAKREIEEMEAFLQQSVDQETLLVATRLGQLASRLTPEQVSSYHRQITQALVLRVHHEFRQQMSKVRQALEQVSRDYGSPGSALCATVLSHLHEIEDFINAIGHFFESVGTASPSGGASGGAVSSQMSQRGTDASATTYSEESKESMERLTAALPVISSTSTGFVLCCDCGHNGSLSDSEMQQLALHLRAARFGKYRLVTDEEAKDKTESN